MNTENVRCVFGDLTVEAKPAASFAGFAGRVHATERAAIVDIASNTLAQRWLKSSTDMGTFLNFLDMLSADLNLSEAALKLARFKAAA